MSDQLISKILTQSYMDLDLDIPTAHENFNFDPTSLDQFIDLSLLPGDTEVISKDTLDEELGIYQISIYTRSGTSTKTAQTLSGTIRAYYKHGLELTSGTQRVFIDRTSRNIRGNENGWYIIDLSINYIAYLLR